MSDEVISKPKIPYYRDVDGFRIPGYFSADALRSTINYKPRPDDLFIVTYPKCGTTWMQNIVAGIFRKGKPFDSALEFLTQAPFMEMAGADAARTMSRPGSIKIHLPFNLTPWSTEAKYIFVARNPKDCCVSFYYHTENLVGYNYVGGEFDDYFELFINGQTDFGDYFDCLQSWYEHRNDPNVLFLTYEQMKKDTRGCILQVAEFIDPQCREELEKDEQMMNDIIKHSSFSYLKKTLNPQFAELSCMDKDVLRSRPDIPSGIKEMFGSEVGVFKKDGDEVHFVRKGIVGDWRNVLSPEQNKRLEEKFWRRTAGTDLADFWKDDMFN